MAAPQLYISFDQKEEAKVIELKAVEQKRLEYLTEFKESYCDLFDMADFEHYAEMTGLPLSEILSLARYHEDDYFKRESMLILSEHQ